MSLNSFARFWITVNITDEETVATNSPCPVEPNQKRLLVLSTIYTLTPADIVKKIVSCASCGAGYLNVISPTFHHPFPTGASYQFTSALLHKMADKTPRLGLSEAV